MCSSDLTVAAVWDMIGASDGGGTDEVEDECDHWTGKRAHTAASWQMIDAQTL